MSQSDLSELADRRYIEDTLSLKDLIDQSFLNLAERLWYIREKVLWRHDYAHFNEFVKELDVTQGTASRLMKVYEVFVVKFRFPTPVLAVLPWTTLYSISRSVKNKEQAETMLAELPFLKGNEVNVRMHEISNGKPCDHEFEEVHMRFCKKCPLREGIGMPPE